VSDEAILKMTHELQKLSLFFATINVETPASLEASKITLLEVVVDEADERAPALEEGDETEAGADKLATAG
jgi:cob(I)alamin adenosyltransferase